MRSPSENPRVLLDVLAGCLLELHPHLSIELDVEVEKLAERFNQLPHLALEKIKAGLNQNLHSALADALEFEAVNQDECFHSDDFIEGITAFLQKRKANFKGL